VRRVAAVDCGTNSLRLLIAEPGGDSTLVELDRQVELVRLGQGVDATGSFHPEALARTLAALDRYAARITSTGVDPGGIRVVATSATRDVANRDALFDGVRARLGVTPEVISGAREAELSYAGALSAIRPGADAVLVMDIGGGSTELILGAASGAVEEAVSCQIGSVRLTERFLTRSPPSQSEIADVTRYIDAVLDESGLDVAAVRTWIGVAGTFTTLAALAQGIADDPHRVHGSRLNSADLAGLSDRLLGLSAAEIRAIPGMQPGRADVIAAGALIAARMARRLPVHEAVVSLADILDGVALELLGSGTIAR